MTVVVALSAERGAGKTTLAAATAADLGVTHVRVSSWLSSRLKQSGREPTPDALREVGEIAVANPRSFVADVLTFYGWQPGRGLVFDAVRHSEILVALREYVTPQQVVHVVLSVDREVIGRRLAHRGDTAHVEAGKAHSTEAEVPLLVATGDVLLDAALPIDVLVERVRWWCQARR